MPRNRPSALDVSFGLVSDDDDVVVDDNDDLFSENIQSDERGFGHTSVQSSNRTQAEASGTHRGISMSSRLAANSARLPHHQQQQQSHSSSAVSAADSTSGTHYSGSLLGKRKGVFLEEEGEEEGGRAERSGKRAGGNSLADKTTQRNFSEAIYYKVPARTKVIQETENLAIVDEDQDTLEDHEKPVRELHKFAFFDPSSNPSNCLVSLIGLEHNDGVNHQFEGAGYVLAAHAEKNDEDEGQEDEEDTINGKSQEKALYIHLGAIFRFSIDFSSIDEPVYIETQYAYYILKSSSSEYQNLWEAFYTPWRISQIAISSALELPLSTSFKAFVEKFASKTVFGEPLIEDSFLSQAESIHQSITTLSNKDSHKIMSSIFITHILSNGYTSASGNQAILSSRPALKIPSRLKGVTGNLDNAVLHPDNQTQTVVTAHIAQLADGHFRETVQVVGKPPPPVKEELIVAANKATCLYVWELLQEFKKPKKVISSNKKTFGKNYNDVYLDTIQVNDTIYKVGDTALFLFRDEKDLPHKLEDLPSDSKIADFFWFGYVMFIHGDNHQLHVQWFNHGTTTLLSELANPQELFLDYTCDDMSYHSLAGIVNVDMFPGQCPNDYICSQQNFFSKFQHNRHTGSFVSLNPTLLESCTKGISLGKNCYQCLLNADQEEAKQAKKLHNPNNILNGFSFGGVSYHYHDFVLYHAENGPGHIGFIDAFKFGSKIDDTSLVTLKKVGRMHSLPSNILPETVLKDPKHLYLTKETVDVPIKDFVRVVYVTCKQSLEDTQTSLEDWVQEAPDYFYITWSFPKLHISNWNAHSEVSCKGLNVCSVCCREQLDRIKQTQAYSKKANKLAVLDLFGGVGAFSKGLADGSKQLEVTHAIELSPSAAETFRTNSPNTIVYNQCANEVLQYAVRLESLKGHEVLPPVQIYDSKTPIPLPPKPGQIAVITAGFPCQGHSSLNMFKNVNDRKNNLILTTLSYIDFYKPSFVYFENVPGFLKFALAAKQLNLHQTIGGIEAGGLKLCVKALLNMNYQVQFGLLQAAHYGTPQRRLRFFLVAAKHNQILPKLPQPTHNFPDQLPVKIKLGSDIPPLGPIFLAPGTALHTFVNVEDAIGDLLQFDWKHPIQREEKNRKATRSQVLSIECHEKLVEPFCGPSKQTKYQSEPQTRYQKLAQNAGATVLQHYTKKFHTKRVERVLSIPLKAKANYQSIPAKLGEWQLVDPSSAMGTSGYKPGAYSRIDKTSVFQTTVTNIDPTAKQCQVLHPWCHRVITVRELARSQGFPDNFVFKSLGGNIIDMHRQIGNAVPLPIGHALGQELRKALFERYQTNIAKPIQIIDEDE